MTNKTYLTPQGKKQLEEKLAFMKGPKRQEIVKRIGFAREFGDLSENSEYDIAKEAQAQLEVEIEEIEEKLRNCIIIDEKKLDTSKVSVGCTVKVYDAEFDEEIEYKIVGVTESDPKQGLISNESPVGKALIGKEVGDTIQVETPAGNVELKILNIRVK